jgi:hypothetical protein
MAHLVETFFGIPGLVTDVQGKHILFWGDRGNGRYPVPFILPPQNAWIWAKAKYLCNTTRFGTFYGNKENKDKLWLTGASKAKLTETLLPCLLALPTFIAEFLGKRGGHVSHTNCKKLCLTTLTGGNCRSRQPSSNSYWIGNSLQCDGEMTKQASLTLGHQNQHCAGICRSSSSASCALMQPWGRNRDKRWDNTMEGGPATYNWSNKSGQTWGRASWLGSKRWHQASWGPCNRGGGCNKDSSGNKMGGRL